MGRRTQDLTGKRFGMLVPTEYLGKGFYLCKCDCGNEKIVRTGDLNRGETISCGCRKEKYDLTGRRFGKLLVLQRDGEYRYKNGHGTIPRYLCQCDCGNTVYVLANSLRSGNQTSCGCEKDKYFHKTHEMSKSRLYKAWIGMKSRCYNRNSDGYSNYGGRGIKICDEWIGEYGFENFSKWAYANGYDENAKRGECTIDRIDVNGNYEPSNCRYADSKMQATNKRNSIHIEYNGEIHSPNEWDDIMGLRKGTVYRRIHENGWSVERAIITPIISKYSHVEGEK